ncbi:DUF1330 domain-containing protein [Aquimarina sp. AU474]|uniref:DUF1330 domain-containing protein n=1 Tax=Aquimarina sp. AU474 TaxID=2108529 RepID=UPI000D68BD76|nr:DUF1330 domain-containing protein [Aquimarina sp. AU474]
MAIESLIALQVTNNDLYNTYREKMTPILLKHNGSFGYDFKIEEVLKAEINKPINRVFTIKFKDEIDMESFFNNKDYLMIKEKYFSTSVASVIEIARYERNN